MIWKKTGLLVGTAICVVWILFQVIQSRDIQEETEAVNDATSLAYPSVSRPVAEFGELAELIDEQRIRENVIKMSAFPTRRYNTQYGKDCSDWVYDECARFVKSFGKVEKFEHIWRQNSVLVTIPGSESSSESSKSVILGAHIDSAHYFAPIYNTAPGADDNASGVSSLLEILRLYVHSLESGTRTRHNTVQFHFYAAEEAGLLGSSEVSGSLNSSNVLAVLIQDQIGSSFTHKSREPKISVCHDDYTSKALNAFVVSLVGNYCSVGAQKMTCGYGCSDHKSAADNGLPATLVTENTIGSISHFVHTQWDTVDRLDFAYIAEFVKLGLAFLLELERVPPANQSAE